MPTYEYRCSACGHEFELFQSMTAPVKRKCPSCGKNSLARLIGAGAGIIFKGAGFYQTDYRSDSYRKAAEADKKATESGGVDGAAKDQAGKKTDAPRSEASPASAAASPAASDGGKAHAAEAPRSKPAPPAARTGRPSKSRKRQ